jgi:hypothetical protein
MVQPNRISLSTYCSYNGKLLYCKCKGVCKSKKPEAGRCFEFDPDCASSKQNFVAQVVGSSHIFPHLSQTPSTQRS